MNLKAAMDAGRAHLGGSDISAARLESEILMMHALVCDRAFLYAHPEKLLSPEEESRYQALIEERASGKPIQYITGHQEFWGMDLIVSPAVLIPRPETEHVVETSLHLLKDLPAARVVDVGTGSGCIALALARELPGAKITALDISPKALDIARANAQRFDLSSHIDFRESDLLKEVSAGKNSFDLVVANPPYAGEDEPEKVQRQVRDFEPRVAVFAGRRGLDIYARLIPQALEVLKPAGWLVIEIGYAIEEPVCELLAGWSEVSVTRDLQGIPRVVAARKG